MKKFSLLLLVFVCLLASCLLASCSEKEEATEENACQHEYDYWQIQLKPTCDEEGKKIRFCYHCQEPQRETIEATGHTWVNATCTAPKTCSTCFKIEGDVAPHTEIVLEAVAPIPCKKQGLTEGKGCSVCGEILVAQKPIDFHTPEVIPAKDNTCTTTGLTEGSRCSECKAILVAQEIVPPSHKLENVAGKAPTCEEAGYTESVVCKDCGYIEVAADSVDALGHDTELLTAGTPSTCTQAGTSDTFKCKACSKTFGGEALPLANHNFVDGTCTACPELDPDYIPADGGKSWYDDVVARYKYLILYKSQNQELPPLEESPAYYEDALRQVAAYYGPETDLGFAYKDINGDGRLELLLMGIDTRIYALFTIANRQPVAVRVFQDGMGYLAPDGMVFSNTKVFDENTNQLAMGCHMEYLVGTELVGFEYGWVDGDNNYATPDDEVYYKVENGVRTEIDHDTEYKALRDHDYEYYWSYSTRLTKLSNLKYSSALIDSIGATITADFSTYDAIINTFKLMRTEVVGTKYDRSKWTSGQYDNSMLFNSYEDFVIYNRILGAIALNQSSTSSSKFGHILKDLNGDGVNELILLDKYVSSKRSAVFAIFTLVDDKPVLLDTYTDLHYACIGADGLIYVADRHIPGAKKDLEYTVYKVENGALTGVASFGYNCDKDTKGAQNSWYKIVDGEAVSIEQEEYTELHTLYIAPIHKTTNATNFGKFTYTNLIEEFVEIVIE